MSIPRRTNSMNMPNNNNKTVIIMVGLPARGKSYITKKINNYLAWSGYNSKLFNVGNKRRIQASDNETHNFNFFDPSNLSNVQIRDQLALETMDDLLHFLHNENGQLGIFDATNSTLERRELLIDHITKFSEISGQLYNVLFLESMCDDQDLIDKNILLKLHGPDYKDCDNLDAALADFKLRLSNYERCYASMSSQELQSLSRKFPNQVNLSFIKIINIYELSSFNLNCKVLRHLNKFLLNFNNYEKNIYITLTSANLDKLHQFNINENLSQLTIFSTDSGVHNEIVDDRHQLISDLESIESNLMIISDDFDKLNMILNYYNIKNFHFTPESSSKELIYCINSSHYNNELFTFRSQVEEWECDAPPQLCFSPTMSSRSNSSSNLKTPVDSYVDLPKLYGKSNRIMEEFINQNGDIST